MDLQRLLDLKGLRRSQQRLAVLSVLVDGDGSRFSPESVCDILRERGHVVTLPTIYRTLALLAAKGIADRCRLGSGHSSFAAVRARPRIAHTVCSRCGSVQDLVEPTVVERLRDRAAQDGFEVAQISIELKGLCAACQAAAPPAGIRADRLPAPPPTRPV